MDPPPQFLIGLLYTPYAYGESYGDNSNTVDDRQTDRQPCRSQQADYAAASSPKKAQKAILVRAVVGSGRVLIIQVVFGPSTLSVKIHRFTSYFVSGTRQNKIEDTQGHHHNGYWAAGRPHILCSICFRSFGALAKAVRLLIASHHNQPMYAKMCSIDIFHNLQLVG